MAGFETPKKTIELGEALIADLKSESHSTPLSRWVAHYLAEQMTELNKATGKERAKAQDRCFAAILQLWRHRDSMPSGLHPFAGFDPVLRALETISPDRRHGYYIRDFDEKRATDKRSADVVKMARFIVWTDRTARILIEVALETAVEQAKTPRTKAYLKCIQAKAKEGDVIGVTRLMARRRYFETLDSAVEAEETKQYLQKRIEQLAHFIGAAAAVQKDFKRRLEELSSPKSKA
ncbi:hypothetical protein ESB00_17795 [Oleiharenicola lentus]|uniref:Uncharacterized protein n=1 Tax=Oleiharenicola lentus TaxID=2508720 RepID=A0A4Q1C530_9BACT|nr:hypothetical protein [Oleiharenicola lentus]RXK53544.1 hypothetical protein ESB00_17795 [Oleiharenicola lentus]